MTSGNPRKLIRTAPGLVVAGLLIVLMAPMASAQEDLGEDVYGRNCVGCHQPDGRGLTGNFPPLTGNANVQDAAYVEDVIRNGKQGELVVDGVTYDGVMPAFGQLSDEEIAAVIDYVQNRLGVSGGGEGRCPRRGRRDVSLEPGDARVGPDRIRGRSGLPADLAPQEEGADLVERLRPGRLDLPVLRCWPRPGFLPGP